MLMADLIVLLASVLLFHNRDIPHMASQNSVLRACLVLEWGAEESYCCERKQSEVIDELPQLRHICNHCLSFRTYF